LLRMADELVASASDLYIDYDYRGAAEQLRRAELPIRLASRAVDDPETARALPELWIQLQEADLLIRGANWENQSWIQGFERLRDARKTIAELLEKPLGVSPTPGDR